MIFNQENNIPKTDSIDDNQEAIPEKIGVDVLDSFLEQIQRIPFAEICGKAKLKDYYILSIDNLLKTAKKCGLDIGLKNKNPYIFNGRFWQLIWPQVFQHFLKVVGIKQGIPHNVIKDYKFVENLVKQFASEARFPVLTANDIPKINLRNGTLHFTPEGVKLYPHDKQDGLTYQLNYDYDPEATALLFRKYFEQVQPDKRIRKLLWQYIAYVFLPKMNLEKILFLFGGGDNGKSVFLEVVQALIGKEQCCAYSLEGLTGAGRGEYQRAVLGNYLLNVCPEISTRMGAIDTFKKLASREPLQARHPRGKPFIVSEYATSIFSMNKRPDVTERTRAFFRRFLLVPFNVTISEEEKDTKLAEKIIESEMSGVLNFVVRGVDSLLKSGGFNIPPEVEKALEDFRNESDSVLLFLKENRYRPSSEHRITLKAMYNAYTEHCKDEGCRAVQKSHFARQLRETGYETGRYGNKRDTVVYAEQVDDVE